VRKNSHHHVARTGSYRSRVLTISQPDLPIHLSD
jgi:hypothetical protein